MLKQTLYMKKTIITLSAVVGILTLSIIGCKKELRPNDEKQTERSEQAVQSQPPVQFGNFSLNVSVSQYGFLVFPQAEDLGAYRSFVKSSTHGEVQQELSSIGFHSLGETLYGEEYWNQTVTEEQAVDYMFNPDQVFQVDNAIMKPIEEQAAEVKWQFLLVMTPENLSAGSYESLAGGTYDAATMNKFATNPEEERFDLLDFIKDTPTGYEETQANAEQARRPMFGSTTSEAVTCGHTHWDAGSGNCVKDCERVKTTKHYVFWIKVDTDRETIGSWSTVVPDGDC